uniref:Peptidase M13 C-terminal domain-containing protein n=1 Tax=Anopheles melas TaxID=34690 RepID=A0A182UDR1_9DIPT
LTIHGGLFLENILSILRWEAERNLQLLRKPVDKNKWATEPAVVNAFYNPNKNDIVFPAGILQPLFYSQNFPKSLNYGGIGVVIGHEITHGFDDKGRQFDKDGNMMQWWNNATIKTFRERAQCIIDQYSRYKIDEVGLYMDGRMTQGENIADNGGLKQSYRAYRKWVSQHGSEPDLPGLNMTHDQLFFLNYAQIWCGSMRPEDALTKIRSSVHSPGIIRVIGPLSNSRDFAEAYRCPLGSPMNPVSKCSVW